MSKELPFEYVSRWPQTVQKVIDALDSAQGLANATPAETSLREWADQNDQRDRDLEDFLSNFKTGPATPGAFIYGQLESGTGTVTVGSTVTDDGLSIAIPDDGNSYRAEMDIRFCINSIGASYGENGDVALQMGPRIDGSLPDPTLSGYHAAATTSYTRQDFTLKISSVGADTLHATWVHPVAAGSHTFGWSLKNSIDANNVSALQVSGTVMLLVKVFATT